MTNQPITPLPELVMKWSVSSPIQTSDESWAYELFIAHQAAQWGADQELEACVELLKAHGYKGKAIDLRTARRPKPSSLKEQALEALNQADEGLNESEWQQRSNTIRRALEQLND
jgi:hypothetical protein